MRRVKDLTSLAPLVDALTSQGHMQDIDFQVVTSQDEWGRDVYELWQKPKP